jgi:hypothetical protein
MTARAMGHVSDESESSNWVNRNHTIVKCPQLVACLLCGVHALEKGPNAGIFLAPKVVGDCDTLATTAAANSFLTGQIWDFHLTGECDTGAVVRSCWHGAWQSRTMAPGISVCTANAASD